jgi:hypothetical protein
VNSRSGVQHDAEEPTISSATTSKTTQVLAADGITVDDSAIALERDNMEKCSGAGGDVELTAVSSYENVKTKLSRINTKNTNSVKKTIVESEARASEKFSGLSADEVTDDGMAQSSKKCRNSFIDNKHKNRKKCKRIIESDDETEELDTQVKPRHKKRRWTDEENAMLMQAFGNDIANKKMPTGTRILDLHEKMRHSRTIAQIRTQVHNYISGKHKHL